MLIDTHLHFSNNIIFSMPISDLIELIHKYDVRYAIVSNANGTELDHQQNLVPLEFQTSQIDVLKESIELAKMDPNRIGIAPWIKPYTERCDDEFIRVFEANIQYIKAIKLHSYHSNIAITDEVMKPYIDLARKHHLPFVIHTGGCEKARCIHVKDAALKYPDINFVMVHLDLGSDHQEALEVLGMADNLYGDTTWVPLETTLEVIKRYGSRKIIFGSDAPIDGVDTYHTNKFGEDSLYLDYWYKLPNLISKEDYENIMYKNAINIFNLGGIIYE